MPELPEVETTRTGILPVALHQTVTNIIIRAPKLRWPIPQNLSRVVRGHTIDAIERRAKYLLLKFDHGTIIIHLGMSGRLRILDTKLPPEKHDHVDICLANGYILRYTDPRRFGAVLWTDAEPIQHKLLKDLGPEPFSSSFTGKYMYAQSRNKKIAIKNFIMDAHIVVGVGNIYASEALFAAKIDPRKPANQVTLEQYVELTKHIKRILKLAIERGGTTLKDFFNASGKPGYFSQQLKVYGRDKMACFTCGTIIQSEMIGQRNTFFCTKCQT